jgi:hypothetical protein
VVWVKWGEVVIAAWHFIGEHKWNGQAARCLSMSEFRWQE